jgi:hypothetical protein
MSNNRKGSVNRKKGHNAERYYAKVFKEDLGFSHCVTSRYGSRIHDDAGIDLINLPINVQIKTGKQKGMNPSQVLSYTKEKVAELFPKTAPEHDLPTIVIHRKEVGRGRKRNEQDDLVHMSFEDFKKLINRIEWD